MPHGSRSTIPPEGRSIPLDVNGSGRDPRPLSRNVVVVTRPERATPPTSPRSETRRSQVLDRLGPRVPSPAVAPSRTAAGTSQAVLPLARDNSHLLPPSRRTLNQQRAALFDSEKYDRELHAAKRRHDKQQKQKQAPQQRAKAILQAERERSKRGSKPLVEPLGTGLSPLLIPPAPVSNPAIEKVIGAAIGLLAITAGPSSSAGATNDATEAIEIDNPENEIHLGSENDEEIFAEAEEQLLIPSTA